MAPKTPAAAYQKSDLVWECVKKNNCFMRKFNGVTLSKEPLNLTHVHAKRSSGLTGHGVGVVLEGRKATLLTNQSKGRNPRKNVQKMRLGTSTQESLPKVAAVLAERRPDMIPEVQKAIGKIAKLKLVTPAN